jgi:hypothetical protein
MGGKGSFMVQSIRCLVFLFLFLLLLLQRVTLVAQETKGADQSAANPQPSLIKPDKRASAASEKVGPANGSEPLENFNTLVVPAGLSFDALSLGKGDFPEYSRELVRLEWRAGDPIDASVIKPAGVKNPPVILYLYSFPSTSHRFAEPEFCKFLVRNGFAAVGFVSALTGERFHERPMKTWFVSELQESLATSVHDVQLMLNYLTTRGDLDMTRVGMFGDGSGASIAIMAAAVDSRIKAVDLLDPWGDWREWLAESMLVPDNERADYLKPEFLQKVQNLDPLKWLPELKTQRVRLQYIEDLTVTPKTARERMEAAAPQNAKVVRYESKKAFLANVAFAGKGFDWIKEELGGGAAVEASKSGLGDKGSN